jgi:glutamate-1-semialdehyde 2,1-aminomutase
MITAIIQARMNSTRFPGKVMKKINNLPLIDILIKRLINSRKIEKIVVATTKSESDDLLVNHVKNLGYNIFRGSEDDVLDRYYQTAKAFHSDIIIRITADCPLIDPWLVDKIIEEYANLKVDYLSNTLDPTFPDGLDIEVFSFKVLEDAWHMAKPGYSREHVTPFIKESKKFKCLNYSNKIDFSKERWTVDEPEDYIVIKNIVEHFAPRLDFKWEEIIKLKEIKPELFEHNKKFTRNIGSIMGKGQKLWNRAKRVIPGGNMLLSKRAEMFLPEYWPAYFSKAKGCNVWDLDGNKYIDVSIMGIGTNILGYGNPEVDKAVLDTIKRGNMSTLNCPEEVLLAERLVEMHPWSEMVRFARSGGEANAIAIRIARASSGKDNVAICGYHGWHDWYLAANLQNKKNLVDHLLPGLDPAGVPKSLEKTIFPFTYNNYQELEEIVKNNDIGVIKMEVTRNLPPVNDFLLKVRKLATDQNIVLIFDECTSGFRQSFGGLHKIYNIEPDMAMFGKALGNGYAITAVIGRREIMETAQKTFISSTFWTERIGPSAAVATLNVMERIRSWEVITETGNKIKLTWQMLADKHGLSITQFGIPALSSFSFNSDNNLAYKTYITQEMLNRGYLASNSFYVSTEHSQWILDQYFNIMDELFAEIKKFENGSDVFSKLKGPICHSGFKRLN